MQAGRGIDCTPQKHIAIWKGGILAGDRVDGIVPTPGSGCICKRLAWGDSE